MKKNVEGEHGSLHPLEHVLAARGLSDPIGETCAKLFFGDNLLGGGLFLSLHPLQPPALAACDRGGPLGPLRSTLLGHAPKGRRSSTRVVVD